VSTQIRLRLNADRESLIELPSTKSLATIAMRAQLSIGSLADNDGNELTDLKYSPSHVYDALLLPFVSQYVDANDGRTTVNQHMIKRLATEFIEAFTIGAPHRHVALLENFQTDAPRIAVGKGLWIEPLAHADKEKAKGFESFWATPSVFPVTEQASSAIVWLSRIVPYESFDGGDSVFDRVVLALRLTKSEVVGYRSRLLYGETRPWTPIHVQAGYNGKNLRHGSRYSLSHMQEAVVRKIWRAIASNAVILDRYSLAIRRFEQTYLDRPQEDQLIDAWVSLESIFMPDGETREATYRLSLRIAYFLGHTAVEREEIDRHANKSYRLRSDIVHGRAHDPRELKQMLARTSELLRTTLRTIILTGEPPDVERIDRAVRMGRRPRLVP
jgi:hypothetical protein